jgi:cellobiose-specific phosphotransferase system component IIC
VPLMLHEWWVIYPVFGWLIGLMIHATAYILYARGTEYATRGIVFHVVAYIFTMLLLLLTDYMSGGVINWAYWPALFWGVGIIGHVIIKTMVSKKTKPEGKEKVSKKERAIEKEMQKMREKMKED